MPITPFSKPTFQTLLKRAKKQGDDNIWPAVALDADGTPHPKDTLRSRDLFAYALTLCEANQNTDRLDTLLNLAYRMQDRKNNSRTYGNFWWNWKEKKGNKSVNDPNGVEFCMRGGSLLWLRHQNHLPESVKPNLIDMLQLGAQTCLKNQIPEKYTNIFLMNAMNLIFLGEGLNETAIANEGYARLDRFCIYTYEWGIHEYCTPTYTAIHLYCLGLIARFAKQKQAREKARVLLSLFWAEVGLNWFPIKQRIGGAQSRLLSDYATGEGSIDTVMWIVGWLSSKGRGDTSIIFPALVKWQPKQEHYERSLRFPRHVQQSWGPTRNEARTHHICKSVTLSTANAQYDFPNNEDMPLTADFTEIDALPRIIKQYRNGETIEKLQTPGRCYFLPDHEQDPYGNNSTHHAARVWLATQQKTDAIALALYDTYQKPNLDSHFVMPLDVDSFWINDRPINLNNTGAATFDTNSTLVVRHKNAAIGVRIIWSRTFKGQKAPALFYLDQPGQSNNIRCARLTVHHQFIYGSTDAQRLWTHAGVALWIRSGENLNSEAQFHTWQRAFANAPIKTLRIKTTQSNLNGHPFRAIWNANIQVKGNEEPLKLQAVSDDGRTYRTSIVPAPSQPLLSCDAKEVGRPLLQKSAFIRDYENSLHNLPTIQAPGYWPAEQGRVIAPMTIKKDASAYNGQYVWMPDNIGIRSSDVGNATYCLNIPKAGIYQIWGRVKTPNKSSDSFFVRIYQDNASNPICLAPWLIGTHKNWTWAPIDLSKSQHTPTPLILPKGNIHLQLFARESGTRIDRLFITNDNQKKPR